MSVSSDAADGNDVRSASIFDNYDMERNSDENKNTRRKTLTDMRIFTAYMLSLNETRKPETIPPPELDRHLATYFSIIKKHDGNQYEPASLRGMLCSIERHLRTKNYPVSLTRDAEFVNTRNMLKEKQKFLRELAKTEKCDKQETLASIAVQRLNQLYIAKEFGPHNATSIVNTLCFSFVVHLRIKKAIDHKQLLWGDIILSKTPAGDEYLAYNPLPGYEYCRLPLKGVSNMRLFGPSHGNGNFNDGGTSLWDTIAIYKLYCSKRPLSMMSPGSPFYLGVSIPPQDSENHVVYKPVAMGVNKLNDLVRMIRDITGSLPGPHGQQTPFFAPYHDQAEEEYADDGSNNETSEHTDDPYHGNRQMKAHTPIPTMSNDTIPSYKLNVDNFVHYNVHPHSPSASEPETNFQLTYHNKVNEGSYHSNPDQYDYRAQSRPQDVAIADDGHLSRSGAETADVQSEAEPEIDVENDETESAGEEELTSLLKSDILISETESAGEEELTSLLKSDILISETESAGEEELTSLLKSDILISETESAGEEELTSLLKSDILISETESAGEEELTSLLKSDILISETESAGEEDLTSLLKSDILVSETESAGEVNEIELTKQRITSILDSLDVDMKHEVTKWLRRLYVDKDRGELREERRDNMALHMSVDLDPYQILSEGHTSLLANVKVTSNNINVEAEPLSYVDATIRTHQTDPKPPEAEAPTYSTSNDRPFAAWSPKHEPNDHYSPCSTTDRADTPMRALKRPISTTVADDLHYRSHSPKKYHVDVDKSDGPEVPISKSNESCTGRVNISTPGGPTESQGPVLTIDTHSHSRPSFHPGTLPPHPAVVNGLQGSAGPYAAWPYDPRIAMLLRNDFIQTYQNFVEMYNAGTVTVKPSPNDG